MSNSLFPKVQGISQHSNYILSSQEFYNIENEEENSNENFNENSNENLNTSIKTVYTSSFKISPSISPSFISASDVLKQMNWFGLGEKISSCERINTLGDIKYFDEEGEGEKFLERILKD